MGPLNVGDFERLAAEIVPRVAWDYYSSGADDEVTLRANRTAYAAIELYYRVLVDVSRRDTRATALGQAISMPVMVAPTAFHRLAHPDGELATRRAAAAAGTVMILSTLSNTAVEEVAAAAAGPLWFQLYVYKDRGATRGLVERVEAAGCQALVLTVDAPLLGRRERDIRNEFQLPEGLTIENMLPAGMESMPTGLADSGLAAYFASLLDPSLSWDDVAWLRSITRLPLVVKGIVRADDAHRAVEHGAAAVVVSNHGGRQLDTSPATIDALPRIAEAIGHRAEVFVDGGVRRGTDVLKAVALGARGVLLGRPILWGLAVDGEPGVRRVLDMVRAELDLAMALCGCPTIADITADLIGGRAGS
jgi:4-hydroxymandelate oxidase